MNSQTLRAFCDEMVKISFLRPVGAALKTVMREGWHGTPQAKNPLWNKALMVGGTGLMAREALRPKDPSGLERSRTERLTGLVGNTMGGMAGASAMMRLMPHRPGLAGVIGGVGGGILGEKLITKPWSRPRADRVAAERMAPPPVAPTEQVPA